MELNYTTQGRRPSAAQIVSDWKKAGKPDSFTVEYGETYAEFQHIERRGIFGLNDGYWDASGNGCTGVNRDAVTAALNEETRKD